MAHSLVRERTGIQKKRKQQTKKGKRRMKTKFTKVGDDHFQLTVDYNAEELKSLLAEGKRVVVDSSTKSVHPTGIFGSDYFCIQVLGGDGHRETIKTWPPWAYARGYAIMKDHNGNGFQMTPGKCAGD